MLLWFKEAHSGVWVGEVMCVIWRRMFCLLWADTVFWSGFFRLLFLRVGCKCNRLSFFAIVFEWESAFNGGLNRWDVAKVTTMSYSKPIRVIVENDLTWRELMLFWLEGSVGGLGWWWWCDVKMVERWCWRMREIKCTPMAHCNNVCDFWLLWDVLMTFHAFWPLWDFLLRFNTFWPLSQPRLFQNSRGLGLVGRGWCKGVNPRVSSGGRGARWIMLWRGESSWLCMKI